MLPTHPQGQNLDKPFLDNLALFKIPIHGYVFCSTLLLVSRGGDSVTLVIVMCCGGVVLCVLSVW
jgi:hypothetical protein